MVKKFIILGLLILGNLCVFTALGVFLDRMFLSGNMFLVFSIIFSIIPLTIIMFLWISKLNKELENPK